MDGACGTSKYLCSASVAVNLVQLNRLKIKKMCYDGRDDKP